MKFNERDPTGGNWQASRNGLRGGMRCVMSEGEVILVERATCSLVDTDDAPRN